MYSKNHAFFSTVVLDLIKILYQINEQSMKVSSCKFSLLNFFLTILMTLFIYIIIYPWRILKHIVVEHNSHGILKQRNKIICGSILYGVLPLVLCSGRLHKVPS